eukprot:snap_masked-scaffold_57-processed-gene-0.48-mRNA-1 protein AED:1.00 eAED:1.00 QI:0/0/0/0/1/1/5/0/106
MFLQFVSEDVVCCYWMGLLLTQCSVLSVLGLFLISRKGLYGSSFVKFCIEFLKTFLVWLFSIADSDDMLEGPRYWLSKSKIFVQFWCFIVEEVIWYSLCCIIPDEI